MVVFRCSWWLYANMWDVRNSRKKKSCSTTVKTFKWRSENVHYVQTQYCTPAGNALATFYSFKTFHRPICHPAESSSQLDRSHIDIATTDNKMLAQFCKGKKKRTARFLSKKKRNSLGGYVRAQLQQDRIGTLNSAEAEICVIPPTVRALRWKEKLMEEGENQGLGLLHKKKNTRQHPPYGLHGFTRSRWTDGFIIPLRRCDEHPNLAWFVRHRRRYRTNRRYEYIAWWQTPCRYPV